MVVRPHRSMKLGLSEFKITREQVLQTINEFYVKRIATDFPLETLPERVKFTPIIPAPFEGKYMSVLVR